MEIAVSDSPAVDAGKEVFGSIKTQLTQLSCLQSVKRDASYPSEPLKRRRLLVKEVPP